ncbi:MAG: hypothetical protein JNL35_07710 [Sphingopyxis sp.]|nr:hypothetical protein [Sphingopyxis sp.]
MMQPEAQLEGALAVRVTAMPANANVYGDIFGGWLMAQMDLAASSVASHHARGRAVTIAVEGMTFHRPVFVGDEVSVYARLRKVGRTSMQVAVEAWARDRHPQPKGRNPSPGTKEENDDRHACRRPSWPAHRAGDADDRAGFARADRARLVLSDRRRAAPAMARRARWRKRSVRRSPWPWCNDELTDPPGERPEGMGAEHRMDCEIVDIEAPRQLAITWGRTGGVTFTLSEKAEGILLTIVHKHVSRTRSCGSMSARAGTRMSTCSKRSCVA